MAKTPHQPESTSNKSAMLIMVAGIVLVGALVVWALTRTVEPSIEQGYTADATTAPDTAPPVATTQPSTSTTIPSATATATTTAPPAPQPQGDRSEVQRIAVEDLRAKLNRNEVTVIDVRDASSFAARRIPGAINVPFASVESMLDQIPKDKPIVTYCT